MRLTPKQKKILWWGGGITAAGLLLYAVWPAPKQLTAPPPPASDPHWVKKGQRVIAWSPSTIVNYGPGKGQVYVKFKAADGKIRGGYVDDGLVLRDPPPVDTTSPTAIPRQAIAMSSQVRALKGLGAGAQLPQQQIPIAPPAVPNAVMVEDSILFAAPEGQARLQELQKQVVQIVVAVTSGKGIFVPDEATFRKIYMHGGVKVLDLVPGIFYKNGKYTTDELANHAHCQTVNAQVVQLGSDWLWPFYNQSVYRYGPDVTPDADLDRYPNSPIDPVKDNAAFETALNAAIESNVQAAMKKANISSMLAEIEALMGNAFFTLLFGKLGQLGFWIDVPDDTRSTLAQFARDSAAKADPPIKLPTTMKVEAIHAPRTLSGLGKLIDEPIPEPMLTTLHASAGTMVIGGMIDMFETHNTDKNKGIVNPCIQELNGDVVLGMLLAVVGLFLTIVSLGSAGLFGPVIAGIQFAINITSNIQQLAVLAGVPQTEISLSSLGSLIDQLSRKRSELESKLPELPK